MFTPGRARKPVARVRDSYDGPEVHTPAPPPASLMPPSVAPSPWPSASVPPRANVVVRNSDKGGGADGNQPVFVCDLPQQLRSAQGDATLATQSDVAGLQGGMDGKSGLSWVLRGSQLYVWNHLRSSQSCVLNMPQLGVLSAEDTWLVSLVPHRSDEDLEAFKAFDAVSVVMCSSKSLSLVYWPDAFRNGDKSAVTSIHSEDTGMTLRSSRKVSGRSGASSTSTATSIQASATGRLGTCVAIISRSDGELLRCECSAESILRKNIAREITVADEGHSIFVADNNSVRRVVWRSPPDGTSREFLLLTAQGIECWEVELTARGDVSKSWTYEISSDKDAMLDFSGQKKAWLLDVQVDDKGEELTLLVASFSKDSSTYMQYAVHYFSYGGGEIKRKAPPQVILPKAQVEEEAFLYSMRLRIGGQPAGSVVILAPDGTATVAYVDKSGNVQLYNFEIACGAGKVLDASVVPAEDAGAWLALTEKAGVWAIPAKLVLARRLEASERNPSHSRTGDHEMIMEDRSHHGSGEALALQRSSSEAAVGSNLDHAIVSRPSQDEEAEAIVGRLFQQFLSSGQVNEAFEKLQRAGAFERDGEKNVFARTSRALVDTFAKHWASGGGSGSAIIATVSSQLADKQRRHLQYLNFLAASKCHDELQNNQRAALNEILEHGEKLASMVALRELNNTRAQPKSTSPTMFSQYNAGDLSGAIWDMIQLVGDKARRNNVVLMDRDKVEVFYTRVSELEELFICIQQHAAFLVQRDQSVRVQIERVCELAKACSTILQVAIAYRDAQQAWYPSPEGITPWYCKQNVRSGLWKIATMLLELKVEGDMSEPTLTAVVMRQVEEMTDFLLEGYAGAITAKVEREEEYRGLQMEYWTRRDRLLTTLQQHAFQVAAQKAGRGENAEQQRLSILQKLYTPLIALARRHAAFPSLLQMCIDLDDHKRLRTLMKESMGLKEGRFSRFVFDQCYQQGQYARLLRFGEEFGEEVAAYLEQHPLLLWLHQLFLRRFTRAADTLHTLAFSQKSAPPNISHRRRLLHLAKLSALAGGGVGVEEEVHRLEADVDILGVQEVATKLGVLGEDVVAPIQLVEACLNSGSRELTLCAFQVFTSAGAKFCTGNRSLLEQAWLRAVDQDDWLGMKKMAEEEGWSDEHIMQVLQDSLLYQASRHCFGESHASSFAKDVSPESVENVIAKHPSYPEAGQAMLTAFRYGFYMGSDLPEDEDEQLGGELMVEM
ncbi:hypothetical protein KC19_11G138400 [Ceratodon purpureus]|uniref:Nuclear pore complex protein Nup133 n=1 Tax=Ceratodon purpureus TaxID=3225 RepID=A0A8T0GES2_CERPU|nr:hypothetical protein KC19_11G138400 [Ceratodon purpureus]